MGRGSSKVGMAMPSDTFWRAVIVDLMRCSGEHRTRREGGGVVASRSQVRMAVISAATATIRALVAIMIICRSRGVGAAAASRTS